MALITCTECGKVFSDKASACPNCGCPIDCIEKQNIDVVIDSAGADNVRDIFDDINQASTDSSEEYKKTNPKQSRKRKVIFFGVGVIICFVAIVFLVISCSSKDLANSDEVSENVKGVLDRELDI